MREVKGGCVIAFTTKTEIDCNRTVISIYSVANQVDDDINIYEGFPIFWF